MDWLAQYWDNVIGILGVGLAMGQHYKVDMTAMSSVGTDPVITLDVART